MLWNRKYNCVLHSNLVVLDSFRKLHYWSDRDLDVFSFDGECVYEDLRCLRNKTNMPEEKQIRISSNFFLLCKQENEIWHFERYALEKH